MELSHCFKGFGKDLPVSAPKIDMYTKFACPYCVRAKMLLNRKGVEFEEFDITF